MKTYTIDEMKRAFECGRNFQLTEENNFQELIEELNQALRQLPVSGMLKCCSCGYEYEELIISKGGILKCKDCAF